MVLETGSSYSEVFSFTQADVEKFAEVSGDDNPLHLDESYAITTSFKKPIIHGFLSGSIFSKILGTRFPGPGSVYLKQTLEFKRPMYTGVVYEAVVSIKEIDKARHTAILETKVLDKENGKITILGEAVIMNSERL